jgi:hypothetical protein
MYYRHTPRTKQVRALTLLSALAVAAAFIGCAEIPPTPADDDISTVTVEVTGGIADIFPGQEFSVPVGGDTLLFINVRREPNTRIAGIWVDGGRMCCAEESVVRDTGIALFGVNGGVAVVVELTRIDTVPPIVEIVSPLPAAPGEFAASVPVCSFGTLEYRLNKAMANGYIKWRNVGETDFDDRDSLQTVRIPADITKYGHEIGDWSYAAPDEGLQKFDLTVSPVAGKRVAHGQIAAPAAYSFEVRFADSLGNKSEAVSRVVWVTAVDKGCP